MAQMNHNRDIRRLLDEWPTRGFKIINRPFLVRDGGRGKGRRRRLKPNDQRTFLYYAGNEARRQARDAQRLRIVWDEEARRIARDVLAIDLARMVRTASADLIG